MLRVVFEPDAEQDIDEIRTTTLERWGDAQARKYRSMILDAIEAIARNPRIGRSRSIVRSGVLAFPVRRHGKHAKHIIFYRIIQPDTVDVLRILHEGMDFDQHIKLSIRILQR